MMCATDLRQFAFAALVLAGSPALADDGYYGENLQRAAPPLHAQALRAELRRVLESAHLLIPGQPDRIVEHCPTGADCRQHASLSYDQARRILFGRLDLVRQNNGYGVNDVYCGRVIPANEFPRGQAPGPDKIPDPRVINTEHAWPQSKFSPKYPENLQKSDLHILFSVATRANSLRNNFPFGEVTTIRKQVCEPSALGWLTRGTQNFFLPPPEIRGDLARAVFYFAVRYNITIDADQEEALRRWHRRDPVTPTEQERVDTIFTLQGNRNPFVDRPEWVDAISDF